MGIAGQIWSDRRRALAMVGVCLALPVWADAQKFPDVVGVRVTPATAGAFNFDATISSPYDSSKRYADGFRAMSEDGKTVFGVRPLLHDHAGEQPFTRDLYGVQIPLGIRRAVIQGRDQLYGWGGGTKTVELPGR